MPVKVMIGTGKSEENEKEVIRRAIELSHEWLNSLDGKDVTPDIIIRCLAHSLGHVLLGCPSEKVMKVAMMFFMQELDFQGILNSHKEEDEDEEDSIGNPISASIN